MSDGAMCACLTVKYVTQHEERGAVSGRWLCTLCNNQFIAQGAHLYLRDEAVRKALKAVCVKKPEAGPMGGLEGDSMEQALKSDARAKEMGDPGTRHAAPLRHEFFTPSPTEGDLPAPSVATIKAELEKPFFAVSVSPDGSPRATQVEERKPTSDLPAGMKMVLWVPIQNYGETLFQCSVEGFGLRATESSRSKQKALAYCLESLARQMVEADRG